VEKRTITFSGRVKGSFLGPEKGVKDRRLRREAFKKKGTLMEGKSDEVWSIISQNTLLGGKIQQTDDWLPTIDWKRSDILQRGNNKISRESYRGRP